ncbi:MAG: DNA polymerase [Candidatus Roizmanbacteria bacterium]
MKKYVWDFKKQYKEYREQEVFDCMVAEYLINGGRDNITLESTLERYKISSLTELGEEQQQIFESNSKLRYMYEDIELPLIEVLWNMENVGIHVNKDRLFELDIQLDREIEKIKGEIFELTQEDFNLASPQQVGKILVDTFKIPLKKRLTGSYITNEQELEKHSDAFPIIQKILKFREYAKLKTTYVTGLLEKLDIDNIVHTTYNPVGTSTGRLSSSNPNLQNIPASGDIGTQIKSCFIPSKNRTFISFDYSQQELRILAHITQEQKLIEAFKNRMDVHTLTASQVFNIPYDQVTKEQRLASKTINFGVLYGMGSYGLSRTLNISVDEAQKFINAFFNNFSNVKEYYKNYLEEVKKNGYAETLLGRRKYVLIDLRTGDFDNMTKRELTNYPIQGTAAELMKKTMVDIYNDIIKKRSDVNLILQIHDELVFEFEKESELQLREFLREVRSIMMDAYKLDVPMEVEAKMGENWGSLQKISLHR